MGASLPPSLQLPSPQRPPPPRPPPVRPARSTNRPAYDSRRNRLIIYGGLYLQEPDCSRETWAWGSHDWAKLEAQSPGPCNHFKRTCDAARRATVLFGGQNEQMQQLAKTWVLPGGVWAQVDAAGP